MRIKKPPVNSNVNVSPGIGRLRAAPYNAHPVKSRDVSVADKEQALVLRMSAEIRAQIEAAASRSGQPLTTFIIDAALKKALQWQREQAAPGLNAGVPGYFRTLCRQAEGGGRNGYATPGWYLAATVGSERPGTFSPEDWERQIDAFKALIANHDDDAVWEWLQHHCGRCMQLIPPRRREQFLHGVRRAYEEDLIGP